ncbi:alpha/beta fold hydrolase [Borborobacter arsenicus]|uniref:alpha/beta fold hydrolase n=1 Tax=Borborobacter arsenicus TaxID=1851146 RepID=UPI001FE03D71|nr:alpha/beta hydrolase [Pseudaminobacter arsenicus]
MLLIPGLGGVGAFWRSQIECLAQRFRVIVHDHRGTGRSETSTSQYSVALMADDVLELMNHLHLDTASILGHSTGGVIAQTIAAWHPKRIGDLVLSASWAYGDPYFRSLFKLRQTVLKSVGIEAYEQFGRLLRYPPWYFERNPEALTPTVPGESGTVEVISNRINALLDFDSRGFLSRISARTLIIGALDDAVTPRYLWDELAAGIGDAKVVTLATGGHFCPQTQPEYYNKHLLDFLASSSSRN